MAGISWVGLPTLSVELVDQIDRPRVLQAVRAKQPLDMGPVLLLHMPVVVLVVGVREQVTPNALGRLIGPVAVSGNVSTGDWTVPLGILRKAVEMPIKLGISLVFFGFPVLWISLADSDPRLQCVFPREIESFGIPDCVWPWFIGTKL
jgi:hypothetical protein